jgi:hypothetical protein
VTAPCQPPPGPPPSGPNVAATHSPVPGRPDVRRVPPPREAARRHRSAVLSRDRSVRDRPSLCLPAGVSRTTRRRTAHGITADHRRPRRWPSPTRRPTRRSRPRRAGIGRRCKPLTCIVGRTTLTSAVGQCVGLCTKSPSDTDMNPYGLGPGVLPSPRLTSSSHGRVRRGGGASSSTCRRRDGGSDRVSASCPGPAPLGCSGRRVRRDPGGASGSGRVRRDGTEVGPWSPSC